MTQRYPLSWPAGRPRTVPHHRKPGSFKVSGARITVTGAYKRIQYELDRVGGSNPLISTNMELRVDGLPRQDRAPPSDPGVCLYFDLGGKPHALACDGYQSVPQNLAAIAAHLEATRAISRHGVATAAEMFTAFVALPQPKRWWETLGLAVEPGRIITADEVRAAWRRLAEANHPDKPGGSDAAMARINAARDEGLREIGGR